MNDSGIDDLRWRKSSRSSTKGYCVEVAFADHAVLARDSKQASAGAQSFSTAVWQTFVVGLRANRFDG